MLAKLCLLKSFLYKQKKTTHTQLSSMIFIFFSIRLHHFHVVMEQCNLNRKQRLCWVFRFISFFGSFLVKQKQQKNHIESTQIHHTHYTPFPLDVEIRNLLVSISSYASVSISFTYFFSKQKTTDLFVWMVFNLHFSHLKQKKIILFVVVVQTMSGIESPYIFFLPEWTKTRAFWTFL